MLSQKNIKKGLLRKKIPGYLNTILSRIERGLVDPKLSTLIKIANGLEIRLSKLLDFD